MELFFPDTTKLGIDSVGVRHHGEVLIFNTGVFTRTVVGERTKFFNNVNKWMQSLGGAEEDRIYTKFKEIRSILDSGGDPNSDHTKIKKCITELYKLWDFDKLRSWCRLNAAIVSPAELKVGLDGEGNDLTEKLTYLRDDYYDLVVLSIFLKPLLGIIGEYLDVCHRTHSAKFRDHHTMSLLTDTQLITLEPYRRLTVYVSASLEKEARRPNTFNTNSSVFSGLGLDELPMWLLSKALIRRVLTFSEFSGDNLIANVYNAITHQLGALDKTFGRINDKRITDKESGSGDDNQSVAESYKVKESVSGGDLSILSHYTEDYISMVHTIDPSADANIAKYFINSFTDNPQFTIQKVRMTIVQWVLAKIISPRGIPSLRRSSLINALAVAQTILWHWNLKELCLLINACPVDKNLMGVGSYRTPKVWVDRFESLYPYSKMNTPTVGIRKNNPAIKAINLVADELMLHNWFIVLPKELQNQAGIDTTIPHVVSPEIRDELSRLVEKLNQLQ